MFLPWVPPGSEGEIRQAFTHARSVRTLGAEAKRLADTYFFETLVRVHRSSEGAPYNGLKPAGTAVGPAVLAADKALQTGSVEAAEKLLTDAIHTGLRAHFEEAAGRKTFKPDDVVAGRRYVQAYVPYVHYVEGLWEAATKPVNGHYPDADAHAH